MRKRTGKWFMLRVTDRSRDRESVYLDCILKKVDTYVCAEEPHDNSDNYHYHSIHQRQKSTIKDRLVAKQWTGNENHAFTHLIEDTEDHWRRCLCYISKGPSRGVFPKIIKNSFEFTEQQIWELHYEWWDKWVNKTLTEAVKQKDERNRFHKLYDFIPTQAYIEGPWKVAEEIIQYYQEFDLLEPNDFQLKCYVKSLLRKHIYNNTDKNTWQRFKALRAKEIVGGEFRYESFLNSNSSKNRVDNLTGEARSDKNGEDPEIDELDQK